MKKSRNKSIHFEKIGKLVCCTSTLAISILKGMACYQSFAVEKSKLETRSSSLNTEETVVTTVNSLL